MTINHIFKEKMMQYQNKIIVGNPKSSIIDEIPDDAYVIDTRKDISKSPNLMSPSSLDYAIEYAHSLGYADDKIYLIYECFKGNGKVYIKKGSLCDKHEKEIIQQYKDLGIEVEKTWDEVIQDE